ncbi:Restriction endonuclease [[Clostridium] sordellii]|uniref:restriction endonuclease n=1 Tax=Paraclostridium sordellii TaxID=1505 RepID=UPI0005E776A9|nr:restriction endonuclease [Paeniclostridium sordellii]MDU4412763.1 restriction endonuclease [Paeniclostridium sordellii]MRZ29371.1 hypothetical protein [Paeniclostridium sordellii]CEO35524.1 Restriction endonuclease [[Clostridium] sordellii] [Paeniclostridium sordellii]CEP92747.1 Restriction endonuclease [[Clostridium] sordellii] [Paeniclostridium sordellii]
MILDYMEYNKQVGNKGLNCREGENSNLFYSKRGWCNFCKSEVPKIRSNSIIDTDRLDDVVFFESEYIWQCDNCGWWEHSFESYMESDGTSYQIYKDWEVEVNSALLRSFEVGSKEVPIEILRRYICDNKDKVYNIHHKKMEELVGSIFKEHYNCDVHLVGKSHDGGKDLVLIESNDTKIVQVKRRITSDKVESVKEIRDLLGATLLSESRSCIFVTTADHFSSDAIKTRDRAIEKSIVDSYELYDFHSFMDLMELHKQPGKEEVWDNLIKLK